MKVAHRVRGCYVVPRVRASMRQRNYVFDRCGHMIGLAQASVDGALANPAHPCVKFE